MDRITDEERDAELDRVWPVESSAPMTDAEYAVWLAETKARIAASLADPRPAISGEELEAHLNAYIDELYGQEEDAAA